MLRHGGTSGMLLVVRGNRRHLLAPSFSRSKAVVADRPHWSWSPIARSAARPRTEGVEGGPPRQGRVTLSLPDLGADWGVARPLL